MQTLYELTNDYNIIDLNVVFNQWPEKGNIQMETKTKRHQPALVKDVIYKIMKFTSENGLSLLDLRA